VVIPIHDKNPARRTAYVTYALIALNILVFLMGPSAAILGSATPAQACAEQRFFVEHGAIPRELVANRQLPAAQEPRILVDTADGPRVCVFGALPHKVPLVSVLTAMFIHVSWLHLLGNLLFLYVFGNNVEDRLGRLHFLLFYLAGGYIATYAFAFLNSGAATPLVGASGAIAAVLGAYLFLYPKAKVTGLVPVLFFLPLRFPAWAVLGSWFVLQLPGIQRVIGAPSDTTVAYLAHIAGFIAGFCYVMLLFGGHRSGPAAPARRIRPDPNIPPEWGPPDPYGSANPYPHRFPAPPKR
jgi:membrane associated rhomboid family serine protease